MPITSRPNEAVGNSMRGRRSFRAMPDFKSAKSNGNGNNGGHTRQSGKAIPRESTNAESFYYLKQMNLKTPMVIVMTDGEEIRGCIEWYDKTCLKVNREGAPNLLIQKQWIKYLFKQEELER